MRSAAMVFGIGILFLFFGWVAFDSAQIPKNYIETSGKVIERKAVTSADNSTIYYPTVQFTANNGKAYTFTSKSGTSNAASSPVGSDVTVAYNPDNPEDEPKNASQRASIVMSYITFAIGGILLLASPIVLAKSRKS